MARPLGTHNAGFEDKRGALAMALIPRVLAAPPPSFRELAEAASVSVPTLRHYFGDRDGALCAALDAMYLLGGAHIERSGTENVVALEPSLRWFLGAFRTAWEAHGVGRMVAAGLAEGLGSAGVGPTFVDRMLEPSLRAAEVRLALHVDRGELGPCDVRHAALDLLCPVLMALLHQGPLGGAQCRPLDVAVYIEDHLQRFMRGWAA